MIRPQQSETEWLLKNKRSKHALVSTNLQKAVIKRRVTGSNNNFKTRAPIKITVVANRGSCPQTQVAVILDLGKGCLVILNTQPQRQDRVGSVRKTVPKN